MNTSGDCSEWNGGGGDGSNSSSSTHIYAKIQQQKSGVKKIQANNCLIEHTQSILLLAYIHKAETTECVFANLLIVFFFFFLPFHAMREQ